MNLLRASSIRGLSRFGRHDFAMTVAELVALVADCPHTPLVLTGPCLDAPGPTIVHVNEAFATMVGSSVEALVGSSPRRLQGPGTSLASLRRLGRALRAGQTHREVLLNYRNNGEAYWCGVEIHPVRASNGGIELFAAFEAEMVRRRGRPGPGVFGRFVKRDPRCILPGDFAHRQTHFYADTHIS